MSIPIGNLFAMLAFSWRDADLVVDGALGACDFERPFDVAARLLDEAMRRLLRRGLPLGFRSLEDAGQRPRGAIDLARTVRELRTARGELCTIVEDLVEDTTANRVLKAALWRLLAHEDVDDHVRRRLRTHLARFSAVAHLSAVDALRVRVNAARHDRAHAEALWLAHLVLSCLLPDTSAPDLRRRHQRTVRNQLPALFEGFVRGAARFFLRTVARTTSPTLNWSLAQASPRVQSLMPQLRTDICVEWNGESRTLIECKFYEKPFVDAVRSSGERFRSAHLFQLLTYRHLLFRDGWPTRAVLAYASPGGNFDEAFVIEGTNVRVVWIELGAPWARLRAQVLDVVSWDAGEAIAAQLNLSHTNTVDAAQ
jgi:5-methylcytosine-specific restriction endonuclease McrBC regulatory subunit McrC